MPLPLDTAIGCAVAAIPDEELATHLAALQARIAYQRTHLIESYFPTRGRFARDLYPKHLEFFWRGRTHRVRLFLAANRVGKSLAMLIEVTYHMTGRYPHWWQGKRFGRPVRVWLAGDTAKTVRDILQRKWLGPFNDMGTGILPQEDLVDWKAKQGLPEAVEIVYVRHISGGMSECTLKSYDQRREAFQGTEIDVVGLDEEPGADIKTECLLRVMPTGDFEGGMLMLTFTPLMGLTETVMEFCPEGQIPEGEQPAPNYVVNCGWDDVPHLSEAAKAELRKGIPPYQLDARTRGIPVLGSGVIYPVSEDTYLVDPFELPKHWRRGYALDVGWKRTAGLWGAYDGEQDTWYLYHEYYTGHEEPSVHAVAFRAPGEWIHGVFDPAARGRSQIDGQQLLQMYVDLGLQLHQANNAVETGLYDCWERLSTGRIKVFKSLTNFRKEIRLYRRDEKGRVVKVDDHLMDCLAPETRVITRDGLVPIRDMVGTCGQVLGFDGQWTDYRQVRLTREQQQLYRVTFDDGSSIECTADHKFMTPCGWVTAIDMIGISCYNAISNSIYEEGVCPSLSTARRSRNIEGNATISVENTSSIMASACIAQSGKMSMALFPKGCISTISMETSEIMMSSTCNYWMGEPTSPIICKGNEKNFLQRHIWLRPNGTEAREALPGTGNTMSSTSTFCISQSIGSVINVGWPMTSKKIDGIDFAPTTASRNGGEHRDWIENNVPVLYAQPFSSAISTFLRAHAGVFAVNACVDVRPTRISDTYCMEVPHGNAFAVEGGMLVHNCFRYLVASKAERALPFPVPAAPKVGPQAGWGGRGGWMRG